MTVRHEDVELVARTLAGDRGAFDELLARHHQLVYRLAARLLANRTDAEDVTQQTFVRAYRSLRQFDLSRNFPQWLCAIAVNCARSFRRREAARQKTIDEASDDTPRPSDVFSSTAQRHLASRVHAAIAALPMNQRLAAVLMELEGMTAAQAAEVMQCSEPTARVHLWRAKKKLAAQLAPWAAEEGIINEVSTSKRTSSPAGDKARGCRD